MAVPSATLDLSAEALISTTIALRWTTPTSDGGSPITGYQIERDLNDTGFVILVADTASTSTAFDDTTLVARDNAKYRVSAINGDGIGPPSDTSSATTSTSEAQTIRDLLFDNWSLTGELSKNVVNDMTEVVNFFDRAQVPGNEETKSVVVQKINELGNENIVEHPKFFEQSDTIEVTCKLQVTDAATGNFSVFVDLMQQMTGEVIRILKTQYSPSTTTGEFFRTNTGWTKDNTYQKDEPVLARTLRFTLTKLVARTQEVFLGYGGVMAFDVSNSDADSLPLTDYIYTEVQKVSVVQGWRTIPYLTTDSPTTTAIPNYYRGRFAGRFSCQMFVTKSDVTVGTFNAITQIFRPQANGEHGQAGFLLRNLNTETTQIQFVESIAVNITSIEKISETEELLKFAMSGVLIGPSEYATSEVIEMTYQEGSLMLYEDPTVMEYESP